MFRIVNVRVVSAFTDAAYRHLVRPHRQENTSVGGLTVYEGRQKDVCLVLQLNLNRVLKDQIALFDYRLDLAEW